MRPSSASAEARISGASVAARLRSNSTSVEPLAGVRPKSCATSAWEETVESTTDWKASTGGIRSIAPERAASRRPAWTTRVRRCDCTPAWTGKELYLNGLNSGIRSNQAAREKAGSAAGQPASPEKAAKRVMPIIGESSTSRSGAARSGSASASSAYSTASAPPLE